jgi:hypothetical protein
MSQELVYRMRTCAAALASNGEPPLLLLRDAADLLAEASNLLDVPEPLGEPMPAIQPITPPQVTRSPATWTSAGELPTAMAQPCPSCGSIDARIAKRDGRRLMLTCPACLHQWEYGTWQRRA